MHGVRKHKIQDTLCLSTTAWRCTRSVDVMPHAVKISSVDWDEWPATRSSGHNPYLVGARVDLRYGYDWREIPLYLLGAGTRSPNLQPVTSLSGVGAYYKTALQLDIQLLSSSVKVKNSLPVRTILHATSTGETSPLYKLCGLQEICFGIFVRSLAFWWERMTWRSISQRLINIFLPCTILLLGS
jgi:hypothetical protein